MVEDIVGIRENAVYQHVLLFSTIFSKGSFYQGGLDYVVEG